MTKKVKLMYGPKDAEALKAAGMALMINPRLPSVDPAELRAAGEALPKAATAFRTS